jgi:hypothetical protein
MARMEIERERDLTRIEEFEDQGQQKPGQIEAAMEGLTQKGGIEDGKKKQKRKNQKQIATQKTT